MSTMWSRCYYYRLFIDSDSFQQTQLNSASLYACTTYLSCPAQGFPLLADAVDPRQPYGATWKSRESMSNQANPWPLGHISLCPSCLCCLPPLSLIPSPRTALSLRVVVQSPLPQALLSGKPRLRDSFVLPPAFFFYLNYLYYLQRLPYHTTHFLVASDRKTNLN